ncbi:MAG: tetratricopeptide repeat protein [Nitrospinaceae bacterium]
MLRFIWIVTAVIVWAMPSPVAAGYQEGRDAFDRGDYQTALNEFKALAEQKDALGQYGLGVMYDIGEGVPQNSEEAARWYRLSAEQGHADAQNNLGTMYEDGEGVQRDYREAVKWYRLAAENGNFDAPNNLGVMYLTGIGMTRNYVKAHMWFDIAGKRGDRGGINNFNFVKKRMTPDEIAEAQKLAEEWVENRR